GNGDGTFRLAQHFAGVLGSNIRMVDFNGDGIMDLAIRYDPVCCPMPPATITILLGNGDGTFRETQTLEVAGPIDSLVIADFNGDAFPDFAMIYSGHLHIFLGHGDGTFEAAQTVVTERIPRSISVVGDFNGDGYPDLAILGQDRFLDPYTL